MAETPKFMLYKRRWFILFIICVLNVSNSTLWISFAPIANKAEEFYCTSKECSAADILSLIYMICSIPMGLIAMWSVDKFGLRTGILAGAWVNFVGSSVRIISAVPGLPKAERFPLVIVGQTIAACSQPFIMYLPTKLAALWFPDSQRALANTLGSMSNPLGILVAMFLAPALVNSNAPADIENEIFLMNVILTIPALLVTIAATLGICSSIPPSPPTQSAAEVSLPFWEGLKSLVRRKDFIVLAVFLGGGMGLFNSIYTLIQQILCPKGYSNLFAGLCGGLVIGAGVVGAGVSGVIADKTKLFEEVVKICYGFAAISVVIFSLFCLRPDFEVGIALMVGLFGAFGFAAYPIGLELGVECTYPVAEATSAGFIIISGQIQGIIYVILMNVFATSPSDADLIRETCTSGAGDASNVEVYDWTVPLLVLAGLACCQATSLLAFFWPTYRRMQAERAHHQQSNEHIPNDIDNDID